MTARQESRGADSRLLTPLHLADLQVRNRMAVAPMTRISASPDGHATEAMARYYSEHVMAAGKAQTGATRALVGQIAQLENNGAVPL